MYFFLGTTTLDGWATTNQYKVCLIDLYHIIKHSYADERGPFQDIAPSTPHKVSLNGMKMSLKYLLLSFFYIVHLISLVYVKIL